MNGDALQQSAHAPVNLNTALMVSVALHYKSRLRGASAAWAGGAGAALALVAACLLAADMGASCLTMSALDTLPETAFAQARPALLAICLFEGWIGADPGTAALARRRVRPRRRSVADGRPAAMEPTGVGLLRGGQA